LKVLHLPTDVGGNAFGLSSAENRIGLSSSCLVKNSSWLNYPSHINLNISQYSSKVQKFYELYKTFLSIRNSYDVFHFNFGTSLIDAEYPFLTLFDLKHYPKNKKLIMTYNGCDARQKYPTMKERQIAACHFEGCYNGMCNSGELDIKRREKISIVSNYASHIFYLNPDLAKFLPKEQSSYLPYTVAGWDTIKKCNYESQNGLLRIVHAPTNRVTKGTQFLISAVEKINKIKPLIELVLVENLTHEKALALYSTADLVIDQLLVGWYGAVSVEVMKMGIPVGCFINSNDLNAIPIQMQKDIKDSFININPFSVEQMLLELLENKNLLKVKANASLDFAHRWHDPLKVAGQVKQFYES
jgi:hypothetical protein